MIVPQVKTREELLNKLKQINQEMELSSSSRMPNTYIQLKEIRHVLRWVLGMDVTL